MSTRFRIRPRLAAQSFACPIPDKTWGGAFALRQLIRTEVVRIISAGSGSLYILTGQRRRGFHRCWTELARAISPPSKSRIDGPADS